MFVSEPITVTEALLNALLRKKETAFLDCNSVQEGELEQSVIGVDPRYIFLSDESQVVVKSKEKTVCHDHKNIYDVIQSYVVEDEACDKQGFSSGFIGMFTYESARYLDDFKWLNRGRYPEVLGGIYDRYIIIDHQVKQAYFISSKLYGRDHVTFQSILDTLQYEEKEFEIKSAVIEPDNDVYKKAIKQVLAYIRQGDVYQVNLSMPYSVEFEGDLSTVYQTLRKVSPAPYSAYINYDDYSVLSSSPELFFTKVGDDIVTKPIKGTIKRGDNQEEDQYQKKVLSQSVKDKAELLMIVDLERNDLNKICQTDTVKVKQLRDIESYQYVHHGVATIEGCLKENIGFSTIMKALFPGGSITGAPKKRAMEIIQECELSERGPYTGCIGYISGNGNMTFNIAIRTLYSRKNTLFFHAGGGIVADSDVAVEWHECKIKAKGMLESLRQSEVRRYLSK